MRIGCPKCGCNQCTTEDGFFMECIGCHHAWREDYGLKTEKDLRELQRFSQEWDSEERTD